MVGTITAPADRVAVRPASALFPALCLLFFASGACGLVYQQLWLRQLSLVFGITVYAVATVLAVFFGGLALGSLLAGRLVARTTRPLHWYGVVEVAIGALALVTAAELRAVERVYVALADVLPDSVAVLTAVRFTLSCIVLIVPATLLGATLPLVVSSSAVRGSRAGEQIGFLYATNTAGAIVGTLLAGFWMIGSLGISSSFRVAAAANAVVGVIAIICSRRWETRSNTQHVDGAAEAATHRADDRNQPVPERTRRLVLAVFVLSGFGSIALEVVWFRVLVMYVESDTYAFTIMLAAVLSGIAVGGFIGSGVLHRWGARLAHLAVIEVAISLSTLASFLFLSKSFGFDRRYGGTLGVFGEDVRFVIVAGGLTVLPTAMLFGAAFPIGLALWTAGASDGAQTGGRVGTFYAANVAAGIAGSLVAGFVLVPLLGSRVTLFLLAAATLAAALALTLSLHESARLRPALATVAVVAFVAAVLAVPNPYASALAHRHPGEGVLWREEGAQTTVSIHETGDGTRVLYLDGRHQANSQPAMVSYHRLIGTLPLAVHPDPQRALVIGLGGGVTAGAISDDPTLSLDVVELSPEVVDGADWLAAVNGDVTNRSNVDVRVDDGRNYLLTTDRRYDIITADLILPQHAGAGKLWSVEYWELTRKALAPGGLMVQWVPPDRARDHEMIVRSFLSVYPYVTAWAGGTLLVGSNDPIVIDTPAFERQMAEAGTGTALAAAGLGSVEELRGMYTADRDELVRYAGEGPLLTDDRPRLEFWRSSGPGRDVAADLSVLRGDADDVIVP